MVWLLILWEVAGLRLRRAARGETTVLLLSALVGWRASVGVVTRHRYFVRLSLSVGVLPTTGVGEGSKEL